MDKQYHLLVCISAHGFGHVAQTAPVLNALHARMPDLRITVRSQAPLEHLRSRIHAPFDYVRDGSDIGMLMSSALDVNVKESVDAYLALHREWSVLVAEEAATLRELAPDFVLSNVGYLPLVGAHHANIPCAAMSSINWADIFAHYCEAISGTHHVASQMLMAYNSADTFLRLTPGMDMESLHQRTLIGPIADVGLSRRDEINALLNLQADEKLILVSLGGIAGHLPMGHWPRIPSVHWLVPASWHSTHPDAHVLENLTLPFSDILASCDVLLCKPGYGSFVEAACSRVPVLYSSREDWPETAALAKWLTTHGVCREVDRLALESGNFAEILQELLAQPKPQPVAATGIDEAADWLEQRLRR